MSNSDFVANKLAAVTVDSKEKLDAAAKKILALKPILARILKDSVEEFKNLSVEEIENKCIEGNLVISGVPVHQDEVMPVITGNDKEDTSLSEGTVTFDLKLDAFVPGLKGRVHLIINVEAQNRTSYPILKRAVYYCGRMLSAQYGTVFTKKHYEKLCKVISIWVCFAGGKKKQNTINRYSLKESQLCGRYVAKEKDYNLLDVVTIYIGDCDKTDNKLLKMLDKIFSSRYNLSEKKRHLTEECGIALTDTVNEGVDGMCNYSDYVYECGEEQGKKIGLAEGLAEGEARGKEIGRAEGEARGKKIGLAEGEARGKEIGRAEGEARGKEIGRAEGKELGHKERLLQDIRKLMKNLGFSSQKSMETLGVSPEEQAELLPLL